MRTSKPCRQSSATPLSLQGPSGQHCCAAQSMGVSPVHDARHPHHRGVHVDQSDSHLGGVSSPGRHLAHATSRIRLPNSTDTASASRQPPQRVRCTGACAVRFGSERRYAGPPDACGGIRRCPRDRLGRFQHKNRRSSGASAPYPPGCRAPASGLASCRRTRGPRPELQNGHSRHTPQ